jgi:hypothetical protein
VTERPTARLPDALHAWLGAGTSRAHNHSHHRKIVHVNAAALMTLGLVATFSTWYAVNGNRALLLMGVVQAPLLVLMPAVPWLNHRGRHGMARLLLLWSATVVLAAGARLATGTHLHPQGMHVVVAMGAVSLIPLRHWMSAAAVVLVNSALFVFAEVYGIEASPAIADLGAGRSWRFASRMPSRCCSRSCSSCSWGKSRPAETSVCWKTCPDSIR